MDVDAGLRPPMRPNPNIWFRADTRSRLDGFREELAARGLAVRMCACRTCRRQSSALSAQAANRPARRGWRWHTAPRSRMAAVVAQRPRPSRPERRSCGARHGLSRRPQFCVSLRAAGPDAGTMSQFQPMCTPSGSLVIRLAGVPTTGRPLSHREANSAWVR